MNSNHSNRSFDREIDYCRRWLQPRMSDTCGYTSSVLLDRLLQRVVEMARQPYTVAASVSRPIAGTRIDCGPGAVELGSGRVMVPPKQWLANLLVFFLHWAFCLFAILFVKKADNSKRAAVLVFGVGEEALFINGSDEQFVNYCRQGPIAPLRNGARFLIQSIAPQASSFDKDFTYSRRPLIDLVRQASIGLSGRLRLLGNHVALLFVYLFAVCRLPQLSLLGKDMAYNSISFGLDRHGCLDAIVLTCSSFTSQPLWVRALRRTSVHMIWYAQNWKPIEFAADKLDSDIPFLRWIRVDTHWVWTHAFAKYLGSLVGMGNIEAVGPIVWRLPATSTAARDAIDIVIFDISPYDDDIALSYGEVPNYNHPNNLFAFIQDILSLKSEMQKAFQLPVSFRLKTKRGYNAAYDRAYFDYLESLHAQGSISIEHHSANLYSLISSSHLVIAYPFTSPTYIADMVGVPSIYYDPTGSICRYDFADVPSMIDFASSRKMLMGAAISALTRSFSDNAVIR